MRFGPVLQASGPRSVAIEHPIVGAMELIAATGPGGVEPELLFCDNDTNVARLYGADPVVRYPKDGINDHVVVGAATVNPERSGTKCAFWYRLTVAAGETVELRLRLRPTTGAPPDAASDATGRRVQPGDVRAAGRGRRVLRAS